MKECTECGTETGGRLPVCDDCAPEDGEQDGTDVPVWGDTDLNQTLTGSFPGSHANIEKWMATTEEKMPFAPWVSYDADRPCGRHDTDTTTAECDHDARRKWATDESYRTLRKARMGNNASDESEGICFIQRGDDPFLFVDGDDVRDPETGAVHPAFKAILNHLGVTFADHSVSGAGIHAVYEGDLPDNKQVAWELDEDPWGSNDDLPKVEIFSGTKVCVMTGKQVEGTPDEAQPVTEEPLEAMLEAQGFLGGGNHPTSSPDMEAERDWDDYEPEATESTETSGNVEDIIYALDHLDPHRVAERTIVARWNDSVSTSSGTRAFYPTWGRNSNGRANIVTERGWDDTGGGGYGGPAVMAAVDAGIMDHRRADPKRLNGEDWWEAVDHLRDLGFDVPEYEPSHDDEADDGSQMSVAIPKGMLADTDTDELRRYLKKRGAEPPVVEDLWHDLRETIVGAVEEERDVVIRAPTGSGKSYTSATEPWLQLSEATGDHPVVLLEPTRKARDEAADMAEEAGVDYHKLRGRSEACPCARGDHDLENADDGTEHFGIEGMAPSKWFEMRCEGQGLPFSVAHSWADDIVPGGLPCSREGVTCPAHAQYDGIPRDDDGHPTHDIIIATHNFAFVPGLRHHANIIVDEEPDFTADISDERAKEAVNAQLSWWDGPIKNFGDLARKQPTIDSERTISEEARRHGLTQSEYQASVERQMENLLDGFPPHYTEDDRYEAAQDDDEDDDDEAERTDTLEGFADLPPEENDRVEENHDEERTGLPPMDWYFQNRRAHTLGTAIARAVYRAEERGNGRIVGKTPYEPPRFEHGDDDGYNRVWVTVVMDRNYNIQTIRCSPDFSTARSVVGLDAHVSEHDPNWSVNVSPGIEVERLLDPTEEALYRRLERGLEVVQVGDAVNPITSRRWWDEKGNISERAELLIQELRDVEGDVLRTAITSASCEADVERFLADAGVDGPQTMHYGATKSRNDFEGEEAGVVIGAIDPGDEMVLNMLAELDLNAEPATRDEPCSECGGSDHGCKECEWTGYERDSGREFEGPDAETAKAALESVRQNEVAQAIGRYARDADDPDDEARVYAMTSAIPENMVDVQVPGVVWSYSDGQEAVYEALADADEPMTAPELAEETGYSRQAVYEALEKAAEYDHVSKQPRAGDYGAHLYAPSAELETRGEVEAASSTTTLGTTHTEGLTITSRLGEHFRTDGVRGGSPRDERPRGADVGGPPPG